MIEHIIGRTSKRKIHYITLVFCVALVAYPLMMVTGCATSTPAQNSTSVSSPDLLFRAIIDTFEARQLEIDVMSDTMRLVSSRYIYSHETMRRRVIGRVVPLRQGVAVNITVEYQKLSENDDGELIWQVVDDDDELRQSARVEETEIGRAVERQFHRRR